VGAVVSSEQISQILVEIAAGLGGAILYEFALDRDGSAELDGPVRGCMCSLRGSVDRAGFAELAGEVERIEFFSLDDDYSAPPETWGRRSAITVVREGRAKRVVDPGSGPAELRELWQRLQAFCSTIHWRRHAGHRTSVAGVRGDAGARGPARI
jgi:hypothetical protein